MVLKPLSNSFFSISNLSIISPLNLEKNNLRIINSTQSILNINNIKSKDTNDLFLFNDNLILDWSKITTRIELIDIIENKLLTNYDYKYLEQSITSTILEAILANDYNIFATPISGSNDGDSPDTLFYILNGILLIIVIFLLGLWFWYTKKKK